MSTGARIATVTALTLLLAAIMLWTARHGWPMWTAFLASPALAVLVYNAVTLSEPRS